MADDKPSLGSAYALESQDEVRALYRDWARTYDAEFVNGMHYIYPRFLAEVYRGEASGSDAPILDVGCGTGVMGEALAGHRIDGLDLSPEMLDVAVEKGVYTRLIEGDLLGTLPLADASYRGVVSVGTFTHGHVGPKALDELIRIAAPGALFCLGVNAEHFEAHGFKAAFDTLHETGEISEPRFEERAIYDADHDHAGDRALIAVFRRTYSSS